MASPTTRDPASYANFKDILITHIDVHYVFRFEKKVLEGQAQYILRVLKDGVKNISLDVRSTNILSVSLNDRKAEHKVLKGTKEWMGENLIVVLTGNEKKDEEIKLQIVFATTPEAQSLQWLTKEQTTDKLYPLVFTYNQPIFARSILPCMDTPSVKFTINYKLSVPSHLVGLAAAIERNPPTKDVSNEGYTVYDYEQKLPIPSYLIAFLCGHFTSADISERVRVWSEPSIIKQAEYELGLTEQQLQLAESFLGKYEWERSDMVVLPSSFPFGGMENPNLIFLTPTLLAGDRSLVHLVTHEQVHSWCGNLVTNATWEHMWLNEGFTTYWERRIGARRFSEQHRQFCNLNAWSSNLAPAVFEQFHPTHPCTAMVHDYSKEGDPISSFSTIFYEKGQVFLYHLEKTFGQKNFDRWFAQYISDFSRKTLNTSQWKEHFCNYFANKKDLLESIDWDEWLFGVGMPPIKPNYDGSLQEQCVAHADLWQHCTGPDAKMISTKKYENFSTHQKIEFMNQLRNSDILLCHDTLSIMETALGMRDVKNQEIEVLWILICLKSRWEPIIPRAKVFLRGQGRLKYTRPIYRELLSWDLTRKQTKELFLEIKDSMHPLGVEMVSLELQKQEV